ncbi:MULTISPECIES: hypothetical protein [unclassified Caulobacter]|uniref:hypothetical protein n=1 Tax=unclassified Caulobacter TaxID=2648921 RepID=UPI001304E8F9|nr:MULTISPECIES: hypothetical protein [unclassified Caulobacter]
MLIVGPFLNRRRDESPAAVETTAKVTLFQLLRVVSGVTMRFVEDFSGEGHTRIDLRIAQDGATCVGPGATSRRRCYEAMLDKDPDGLLASAHALVIEYAIVF